MSPQRIFTANVTACTVNVSPYSDPICYGCELDTQETVQYYGNYYALNLTVLRLFAVPNRIPKPVDLFRKPMRITIRSMDFALQDAIKATIFCETCGFCFSGEAVFFQCDPPKIDNAKSHMIPQIGRIEQTVLEQTGLRCQAVLDQAQQHVFIHMCCWNLSRINKCNGIISRYMASTNWPYTLYVETSETAPTFFYVRGVMYLSKYPGTALYELACCVQETIQHPPTTNSFRETATEYYNSAERRTRTTRQWACRDFGCTGFLYKGSERGYSIKDYYASDY